MLISVLKTFNHLNTSLFSYVDICINKLQLQNWIKDAIIDCLHMLPFLFLFFLLIEIVEFYFSGKVDKLVKNAQQGSVVIGALASILPQCGFSIIASGLYTKRLITKGCLIAVYLGTSDESIPILLSYPDKAHLIVPIIGLKLLVAIFMGYSIDLVFNTKQDNLGKTSDLDLRLYEEGCCNHNPETKNKRELIIHPILHTINIFTFVLVITLFLNYFFENVSLSNFVMSEYPKIFQHFVVSLIGLVPNCATSIAITMMLIKGTISFSVAMSGLLANAGLGLLVLLRNNDIKDTFKIIFLLVTISTFVGIVLNVIS